MNFNAVRACCVPEMSSSNCPQQIEKKDKQNTSFGGNYLLFCDGRRSLILTLAALTMCFSQSGYSGKQS